VKTPSVFITVAVITISSVLLGERPSIPVAAAQSLESHDASAQQDSIEQQIVSKEREGLDALKTGDLERFGNLTADEAVMVDAQGPATKAQVLKNVAGFTLTEYSMEDVRFVPVSTSTGLITYKLTEKGASHGKEFAAQAYVSSLWTKRGTKWVCLFSQETAVGRPVPSG